MSTLLLLVMYKPDGYTRACTTADADSVLSAWNSVLRWLQGADLEKLPESHHVRHVARKAALQNSRFPDYDVHVWRESAIGVQPIPPQGKGMPLPQLGCKLYLGLGLKQLRTTPHWLNRVAIEMIYGREPSFQEHRELLVPRLLDGPVQMEFWTGQRIPLAHATKFLFRHVLSTEKVTNLLHIGRLTNADATMLEAACDVGCVGSQSAYDDEADNVRGYDVADERSHHRSVEPGTGC